MLSLFGRLLVLIPFSLLICLQAPGQHFSAKDIFKKASPSVVLIISCDKHDQPLGFGSGFYVDKQVIATNFHVIEGAARVRVFQDFKGAEIEVLGIKGFDTKRDLALIQVTKEGKPLELATTDPEVGDSVYAIGNPEGLSKTLSSGLVSGIRSDSNPKMVQISAPISPGSSGGPVILDTGQVAGVATSYLEEGQNLNFAVSCEELSKLISDSADASPKRMSEVGGTRPDDAPKSSIDSVRVVKPTWIADWGPTSLEGISWTLTIANDGDKQIKCVDLLILMYDEEGSDLLTYYKVRINPHVPPKLATRLRFNKLFRFDTSDCDKWKMEFRVLSFETEN